MKGLRVNKIVKEIKLEVFYGEVEVKNISREIIHKIFETNSSFHVK